MHWELIKLRKINKISKTAMVGMLDIKTLQTYTSKEDGQIDFTLTEMFTIAKYFNKRIEDVFLPRYIGNTDKAEQKEGEAQ